MKRAGARKGRKHTDARTPTRPSFCNFIREKDPQGQTLRCLCSSPLILLKLPRFLTSYFPLPSLKFLLFCFIYSCPFFVNIYPFLISFSAVIVFFLAQFFVMPRDFSDLFFKKGRLGSTFSTRRIFLCDFKINASNRNRPILEAEVGTFYVYV